MNMFLLAAMIFFTACAGKVLGDRRLKGSEIPAFLSQNAPKKAGIESLEYFEQSSKDGLSYEIKYREEGMEVSLSYDDKGQFLEEERDIHFKNLKPEPKKKIEAYLKQKYQTFHIAETELRIDQKQQSFIDVEVSYADGFLEIAFDEQGNYVSEKVEHEAWIDTIN